MLLPKVSTAGNFLIIAFFLDIFVTPIESIIVTIAGNPSGIAATASPIDVINISEKGMFFKIPIINIAIQIIIHTVPNFFPTSESFLWRGVSGCSSEFIIVAIWPTFVFIPISVIIASPWPLVTIVEENTILIISPVGIVLLNFIFSSLVTLSDSPVRADSSTFKLYERINLASAGT